jgi:hypothetical protein
MRVPIPFDVGTRRRPSCQHPAAALVSHGGLFFSITRYAAAMANAPMPKLRNPPIVEAVFDVDCDLPAGFDLAAMKEPALKRFGDQYPKVQTQFVQQHRIETTADTAPNISTSLGVQALQFRNDDEKQIVQVRAQGFSFNRLVPFTSFDDYLPEIERTWQLYVNGWIGSEPFSRKRRVRFRSSCLRAGRPTTSQRARCRPGRSFTRIRMAVLSAQQLLIAPSNDASYS